MPCCYVTHIYANQEIWRLYVVIRYSICAIWRWLARQARVICPLRRQRVKALLRVIAGVIMLCCPLCVVATYYAGAKVVFVAREGVAFGGRGMAMAGEERRVITEKRSKPCGQQAAAQQCCAQQRLASARRAQCAMRAEQQRAKQQGSAWHGCWHIRCMW